MSARKSPAKDDYGIRAVFDFTTAAEANGTITVRPERAIDGLCDGEGSGGRVGTEN